MKKTSIIATMFVAALLLLSCSDDDSDLATTPQTTIDLTGRWQNVSDTYDVFTFNEDKSGAYNYRYIDETDVATGAITYFPTSGDESYSFDYYTIESNGTNYTLTFFGSPFPISNATMYMLDGLLRVKYDWSDYRGKAWYDVVELYKKIED